MKKILLVFLFLGVLVGGIVFYSYEHLINKKQEYSTVLEIKSGVPLTKSLEKLPISKTLPFRLYLKIRNGGRGIKAGYYELIGNFSIKELIEKLETGSSKVTRVTIPEGYSYKNIIKIFEKDNRWSGEKVEEALKKIEFPYPTPDGNFEGYFYPATYYVPEGYSEERLVRYILNHFLKVFPPDNYPDKEEFYKKLILASVIEREAMFSDEKPRISSVFHNRLKINMALASDATVNYLYDYTKKRMYYKDLEVDSPYNTYKYRGLPPGPIASPDKKSVDAAYNPEETEYLFFVARGDGYHHFTRTYREHLDFQEENKRRLELEANK